MKMAKIIILILASDTYPSKRNAKYQKRTWVKDLNQNIKVLFYEAGNKNELNNGHLTFNLSKSEKDIGYKNIEAFKWVLENEKFDFLFRTNTSSYISKTNLEKYISTLDANKRYIYNGIKINLPKKDDREEINLVSGAGILFNKEVINLVVEKRHELDHELWEDVSIGKLLNKYNIFPGSGHRGDIHGNIFKQNVNLGFYHYRCRIDNHYGYPRFLEKYVLKELHKKFTKEKSSRLYNFLLSSAFELLRVIYIQQPLWKIYSAIKKFLQKILPERGYQLIKRLLLNKIEKFQLRYFKK